MAAIRDENVVEGELVKDPGSFIGTLEKHRTQGRHFYIFSKATRRLA